MRGAVNKLRLTDSHSSSFQARNWKTTYGISESRLYCNIHTQCAGAVKQSKQPLSTMAGTLQAYLIAAQCLANQKLHGLRHLQCCELGASAGSFPARMPSSASRLDLTPHRFFRRNTRRQHTDLGRGPFPSGPFFLPSQAPIVLINLRPCPQVSAAHTGNPFSWCLSKRVTCATRLPLAGNSQSIVAKQSVFIAISDDENSDSGDFAVTSDILPKPKGRGRKPTKKEEEVEEDDDVADTKITNGDADEDDEGEEDDEDDMDEDE